MSNRLFRFLCCALIVGIFLCSCAAAESTALPSGTYLVDFSTDSSMFHVNEAWEGKAVLTVGDDGMSVHLVMPSKKVLNLYAGPAEQAKLEGAALIEPTVESVTYSDGYTENVFAFDVPVPSIGEEFDCALIGTKGVWYDHKVSVSNPEKYPQEVRMEVALSGGSGRASVESPAAVVRDADGTYWATIVWSSKNYESMIVDGVEYAPVQAEGNSTFRIPVTPDTDLPVSALTVAMSEPHWIDYTLHFDSNRAQ